MKTWSDWQAHLEPYWKSYRWHLLGIGLGLAYAFLGVYLLASLGLSAGRLRCQTEEQNKLLQQVAGWTTQRRLITGRIQALRHLLEQRKAGHNSGSGLSSILASLDKAARRAGLTVSAIGTDETVIESEGLRISLQIQAVGHYHQIGDFIDRLEREPSLIIIEDLELQATTGSDLAMRLQVVHIRPL